MRPIITQFIEYCPHKNLSEEELRSSQEEFLQQFGFELLVEPLELERYAGDIELSLLEERLEQNLSCCYHHITSSNGAMREIIVAPMMLHLCRITHSKLALACPSNPLGFPRDPLVEKLESGKKVIANPWNQPPPRLIQGILDYQVYPGHYEECPQAYLEHHSEFPYLLVETKVLASPQNFSVLAGQLMLLSKRFPEGKEYKFLGALTDGSRWQFGLLDVDKKRITRDVNLYQVFEALDKAPKGLEEVIRILAGAVSF